MSRRVTRARQITVAVLLLPVMAIVALALADFVSIGRAPAPCAKRTIADTVALVLSGGPHYRRTRHAVALYRSGQIDRIAFSGAGNGGDSAHNLAREAHRLGVPDAHILIDERARSTAQNFQYACALPGLQKAHRVAIVTDRFHIYRARVTAERQCADLRFCSAPVAGPVTNRRRLSETGKLLAYQLLGRADLW